ncbi:MAG: MFS transporter [Candidatus Latescibacteria bacterium]|nr:MFS transporter [Candidatus Latescibacterota bacterium]
MRPSSFFNAFRFMRGNILVLSISGSLGMFCRNMVFPYTPLFILSLGGQPAEIGFIYALAPLGGLIAFPIAGYLADRADRAKIIAYTGFFSSAVYVLYIVAQSWHWLALARLLLGFAILQHPATSAIVADSLTSKNRGRGMATMTTLSGGLAMLAPLVAGFTLDAYGIDVGMRVLFAIMAVLTSVGATINLFFIKSDGAQKNEPIEISQIARSLKQAYTGIPSLLKSFPPSLRALGLIVILGFMANGIASPFWVVYAQDQIGLSAAQWGLVLLIEAVLGNAIRIPAGFLADRYARGRILFAALLLCCAVGPLFLFANTLVHVVAIRCLIAVSMAFFSPASSALFADAIPREIRGRAMAAIGRGNVRIGAASGGTGGPGVGFLTILPLMAASFAGGLLYQWNSTIPWIILFAITAITVILTALFVRDPRTLQGNQEEGSKG